MARELGGFKDTVFDDPRFFEDIVEDVGDVSIGEPVYDEDGRLIGYKDPETGEMIREYNDLWEQLDEAKEIGFPSVDEWMTQQDYDFYDPMARDETGGFVDPTMQQLQALIDDFTTGPSAMDINQATSYAEQIMGLDPGTYASTVGGYRQTAEQAIGDFQGLTDEERAVRERANRNELRGMEERATRMLDNIQASTGSVSRAYAAADQALSQINDVQIQQELSIYSDEYMRKNQESDKAMQRYQLAVQNGQMAHSEYLNLLQQSKSMAFQGYAMQVNTMMQQNQQYLQEYSADLMAIEGNINNIYKAIQMEIGIDDKIMNDIERAYQMEMAPLLTEMDLALQKIALQQAEDAADEASLFGWLGLGIAVLGIPFTGGRSLVGYGASKLPGIIGGGDTTTPPPALSTIGPG